VRKKRVSENEDEEEEEEIVDNSFLLLSFLSLLRREKNVCVFLFPNNVSLCYISLLR